MIYYIYQMKGVKSMNRLDNNDFEEMEQAIRGMISIFQYMSRCNIKFDGKPLSYVNITFDELEENET